MSVVNFFYKSAVRAIQT
jgi:hypothetical protein